MIPAKTYDSVFLLEDITALLVACAAKPIRVNANTGRLIAAVGRSLAKGLGPMPKWVEKGFDFDGEMHARTAVSYLQTFELAERKRGAPLLEITKRGREWLALGAGDRLRIVVDGVLDRPQAVAEFADFQGAEIAAVAPSVEFRTSMDPPPDADAAVLAPFQSLEGDGFQPLAQILSRRLAQGNPLLEVLSRDPGALIGVGGYYLKERDPAKLRKEWSRIVREFLRIRLLPLGGVRLGYGEEGIGIAITPVGRYFLGHTKDWPAPAPGSQVIVQPNFDVTFLGEALAAEAAIAPFAERRKKGIGALFQITRKSIFAAAAAGMSAPAVIETLERVAARDLPGNLRTEIQAWFGQCRNATLESALLIRRPDPETAARVLAACKGNVEPLSEAVLEFTGAPKQRAGLVQKLASVGVLVR